MKLTWEEDTEGPPDDSRQHGVDELLEPSTIRGNVSELCDVHQPRALPGPFAHPVVCVGLNGPPQLRQSITHFISVVRPRHEEILLQREVRFHVCRNPSRKIHSRNFAANIFTSLLIPCAFFFTNSWATPFSRQLPSPSVMKEVVTPQPSAGCTPRISASVK